MGSDSIVTILQIKATAGQNSLAAAASPASKGVQLQILSMNCN